MNILLGHIFGFGKMIILKGGLNKKDYSMWFSGPIW